MAAAIASKTNVPTIALAMPPPASPDGLGSWVKKAQSNADRAFANQEIQHQEDRGHHRGGADKHQPGHCPAHELAPCMLARGG